MQFCTQLQKNLTNTQESIFLEIAINMQYVL